MTDDQIAEILKLELIEMRGEDAFVDNIDIADLRRLAAEAQRLERESNPVVSEIAAERSRQIEAEGWTHLHDDEHKFGELAAAAGVYALHAGLKQCPGYPKMVSEIVRLWPWPADGWKPKNPRRDLIRAAALIVAEIERLDRAAIRERGNDV